MNYNLSEMSPDVIKRLDASELLSSDLLLCLYDISDFSERARLRALLIVAAKRNGIEKEFKSVLKAYDEEDERLDKEYQDAQANYTHFSVMPDIDLCCGAWIAANNGIKIQRKSGEVVYASKIPLCPVALLENISSGVEKIQIDYYKNGRKSLICERSVTASANAIVKLADKGIEVNSENAKNLVKYISDVISLNLDNIPTNKAVSQLGWNEAGFMPYDKGIVFDGEKENKYLFNAVTQKGDYREWIIHTDKLRKNKFVRLMMAASFASVLIEKVNALPFIFTLYGKTGKGKTVSLMVAMSIWGNPRLGKLVRTLNMTHNSLLSTAAFLNSIPFAGDELQSIKNRWENFDQLIMRITEGIDRGRMSFDKNNEVKSWKCSFLLTGEEPCTKYNSGGGVKGRVIEVEPTDEKLFENPNETVNFIMDNYGYAGKHFVEYVKKCESLQEQFNDLTKRLIEETNADTKQIPSMALMLLADKLSCELIYTNETPLEIDDVKEYILPMNEVSIAERAYEFIVDYISMNEKRFRADGNNGEIWGAIREEPAMRYVLFNSIALSRALRDNGFEFDAVKKEWAAAGYVIKNSQGKFSHWTQAFGIKAKYVKIILPESEEDDKPDCDDADDIPFM